MMAPCMRRNQDCFVKVDFLQADFYCFVFTGTQETSEYGEEREKTCHSFFLIAFKKFFNNFKHVDNALQQHSALVSTYNSPIVGAPP